MGLGIAMVAARYAKAEVLLSDSNEKAMSKSLSFLGKHHVSINEDLYSIYLSISDTLLEKDVKKGKLSSEEVCE